MPIYLSKYFMHYASEVFPDLRELLIESLIGK